MLAELERVTPNFALDGSTCDAAFGKIVAEKATEFELQTPEERQLWSTQNSL
ncbi:unnamed protein product, partial [Prorocentrum cordatum]